MPFTGAPAADFYSMLSGLGDTIVKNRQEQAKRDALAQATAPGADFRQSILGLASVDPHAAGVLVGLQNHADALKQQERENARNASNDTFSHGIQTRAANRADEDKFVIKEGTNPDGTPSFIRVKTTGPEGPIAGLTPPATQSANAQLTGPDFLASLPPEQAIIVKKIADHEIDPNKLSIMGGHRERLMAAASRYDPEYDASLAPARFAAKKEFLTGGPNAPSSTIVSGGTTIGHLLHASDASQKLGGPSGYGPVTGLINKARAGYEEASNDPNYKEYNTTIGRIAEEGTKFYRGVGGTESDIMRDIATMSPGQSQEARDRALATQASLIYSKVAALQDRYKNAMGTKAWEKVSKEQNFPVISAKNREAVNTILKRGGLPELPPEPAKGGTQGSGGDAILQHARDAIAQGADPIAVKKQLVEKFGVDPSGL